MYIEFDTQYNHYIVADVIYHGRMSRVLYSGSQDAAQSGMALDGKPGLLFDYIQGFMDLLTGLRPQSVLLLGGGAFTLPTALLAALPEIRMDVVELDGELVDIAGRFFEFRPTDKTSVHVSDARTFLEKNTHSYDAIVVDVFTHETIPDNLLTTDAVTALRKSISRNGVIAFNVIASLDGRDSAVLYRLVENLQAEFASVQVFPAAAGIASWTAQNFIVTVQSGQRDLTQFFRFPPVDDNSF